MALSQSHVPRYLGATPPEEATSPPRRKPRPPDIFSFDQRTKNPRSAPVLTIVINNDRKRPRKLAMTAFKIKFGLACL